MATVVETERVKVTIKDLKGKVDPDWCPGCGDFGVLAALKQAIVEAGLEPHKVLTVSGIGCSFNPIPLAIAAGATYVARGFTGQQKQLVERIKGGLLHRGFALIDTFSPCVTYNHDNTHEFFKQRTKRLDEMGHDPSNRQSAIERGWQWGDEIPIGLFWKREDLPSLDQLEPVLGSGGPLAHRPLGIAPDMAQALIKELM